MLRAEVSTGPSGTWALSHCVLLPRPELQALSPLPGRGRRENHGSWSSSPSLRLGETGRAGRRPGCVSREAGCPRPRPLPPRSTALPPPGKGRPQREDFTWKLWDRCFSTCGVRPAQGRGCGPPGCGRREGSWRRGRGWREMLAPCPHPRPGSGQARGPGPPISPFLRRDDNQRGRVRGAQAGDTAVGPSLPSHGSASTVGQAPGKGSRAAPLQ